MRRIAVLVCCLGLAAAAGVAGCGGDDAGSGASSSGGAGKTERVTFRLNWVIAGNHAPFYLAKEKGYWKECGLDVTMAAGKGSGDTAQLVATGSQDFGLTDAVSIVAGRSQGLPIKSLGVLYQTNPSSFVFKKAQGITSVDGVAGKKFGAVPGGSPYLLAQALFKGTGTKPGKEVSVPAPGIAQLKTDQVDFITFFGNEVANIDPEWKQNLNVAFFKDAGQDIYGLTLGASDDYAAAHPEQVKCFREGVKKGFEEAKADPDAALAALTKAVPATGSNPEVQKQLLDGAFAYTGDDLLAESSDRWEATQKVLLDAGIAKKQVPVNEIMDDAS
jgi:NitT/TauT family transport system substrate-binding protein